MNIVIAEKEDDVIIIYAIFQRNTIGCVEAHERGRAAIIQNEPGGKEALRPATAAQIGPRLAAMRFTVRAATRATSEEPAAVVGAAHADVQAHALPSGVLKSDSVELARRRLAHLAEVDRVWPSDQESAPIRPGVPSSGGGRGMRRPTLVSSGQKDTDGLFGAVVSIVTHMALLSRASGLRVRCVSPRIPS